MFLIFGTDGKFHCPLSTLDKFELQDHHIVKEVSDDYEFRGYILSYVDGEIIKEPEDLEFLRQEYEKVAYVDKRRNEYPPMQEFADAWVKQDETALEEYRKKCLAVKVKYPKPL